MNWTDWERAWGYRAKVTGVVLAGMLVGAAVAQTAAQAMTVVGDRRQTVADIRAGRAVVVEDEHGAITVRRVSPSGALFSPWPK